MLEPSRRNFLRGFGAALFCTPAIVRASSLMPIRAPKVIASISTIDILYGWLAIRPEWIYIQWEDQFEIVGSRIGESLRIRLPNDFTVRDTVPLALGAP